MKQQSAKIVSFSAFVFMTASVAFAASQPKIHAVSKSDVQRPVGAPQTVEFGKGSGRAWKPVNTPGNTLHLQGAVQSLAQDEKSSGFTPSFRDSAFRK